VRFARFGESGVPPARLEHEHHFIVIVIVNIIKKLAAGAHRKRY
jgi:hypothetical protein